MLFEKDDEMMEAMHEAVDSEAKKAANVLRNKYVIPFCDKYQFRFVSGMGTSFFVRMEDDQTVNWCLSEDIDRACDDLDEPKHLVDATRKLTHEINDHIELLDNILSDGPLGNHFGWDSWMENYTPCSNDS